MIKHIIHVFLPKSIADIITTKKEPIGSVNPNEYFPKYHTQISDIQGCTIFISVDATVLGNTKTKVILTDKGGRVYSTENIGPALDSYILEPAYDDGIVEEYEVKLDVRNDNIQDMLCNEDKAFEFISSSRYILSLCSSNLNLHNSIIDDIIISYYTYNAGEYDIRVTLSGSSYSYHKNRQRLRDGTGNFKRY